LVFWARYVCAIFVISSKITDTVLVYASIGAPALAICTVSLKGLRRERRSGFLGGENMWYRRCLGSILTISAE
jgi:hypothetical protein